MGVRTVRLDISLETYKSHIHSAILRILNKDILAKIHPDRIRVKTAIDSANPTVTIYLDDKLMLKFTAYWYYTIEVNLRKGSYVRL